MHICLLIVVNQMFVNHINDCVFIIKLCLFLLLNKVSSGYVPYCRNRLYNFLLGKGRHISLPGHN